MGGKRGVPAGGSGAGPSPLPPGALMVTFPAVYCTFLKASGAFPSYPNRFNGELEAALGKAASNDVME